MNADPPSSLIRFLFTPSGRVDRATYLRIGLILSLLKYGLDAGVVAIVSGEFWTPLDYLIPVYSYRFEKLHSAPDWLFISMGLWGLPFLWIGLTMSLRRCLDAGQSPLWSLWFVIPGLNYLLILYLVLVPTRGVGSAEASPHTAPPEVQSGRLQASLLAAAGGVVTTLIGIASAVYLIGNYGQALFIATPFAAGVTVGILFNRKQLRSGTHTFEAVLLCMLLNAGLLFLSGIEGLVCLSMVIPLATIVAIPGSLFGRFVARSFLVPNRSAAALLLIPGLIVFEGETRHTPEHEVVTTIDIDAPPESVWKHVVSFSEIPPPDSLLFRTGIAYPIRARIEGEGVGAVRHCEFTTGSFVEPITIWDQPHRLAFDVIAQPEPMEEWSLYDNLHPPHLKQAFRSQRGEFRLIALPGGGTRLEGSTWYVLDVHPIPYWKIYAKFILHRIHERVLEHVKQLAETHSSPQ